MTKDVSQEDRAVLVEILGEALKEAIHGLHHTDSHEYRAILKHRVELLEGLVKKFESSDVVATG